MSKRILWLVVSGLMVVSLAMPACAPAPAEEKKPVPTVEEKKPGPVVEGKKPEVPVVKEAVKPAPEEPKYGGTLVLVSSGDLTTLDTAWMTLPGAALSLTHDGMRQGDWTKGAAGGYGTYENDWGVQHIAPYKHRTFAIAEGLEWKADAEKMEATIVYKIRRGVRYTLDPKREASRLVGGRELTADDVIYAMKRNLTDPLGYLYQSYPALRTAQITKTGPWEVTVKTRIHELMGAIGRFDESIMPYPPEVIVKYGNMAGDWKKNVGTGPFIWTEYVGGSLAIFERNPNYWKKDPIGPGKGNQLPYVDRVQYLIIPDASTRQAALRTGKIDVLANVSLEDAALFRKTTPASKELVTAGGRLGAVGGPVHKPPLNDIRVRQAMMISIDLDTINKNLYEGKGDIVTYPISYSKEYATAAVRWDDPDFPESARWYYKYDPEKAKQLLKEAGHPTGLRFSLLMSADEVDYFSIWKDMWAKVGIELTFDIKESSSVINAIKTAPDRPGTVLGIQGGANVAIWWSSPMLQGIAYTNNIRLDDPVVNKALDEARLAAALGTEEDGLRIYREKVVKYVLEQAYAIPRHNFPRSHFWWPWVKNYAGEQHQGYSAQSWPQYVWIDQALKKSMGY